FTTVRPTNITFTLYDDSDRPIASATGRYGSGVHVAQYYNEIFGRSQSLRLAIRSMRINSDSRIAAIALQISAPRFGPTTLTTFPVVALSSFHKADAPAPHLS